MKEIVGFPMYTLSKEGKIYSKYTGKVLSPVKDITGYHIVSLVNGKGKFKKSIHRLLAEAFLDNPENKAHVNHIDGNKTNNTLSNLEWATPKENTQHAKALGLLEQRDAAQYQPVLKIDLETGNILCEYKSVTFAAKSNGLHQPNITKVCKGIRKSAGGFGWRFK